MWHLSWQNKSLYLSVRYALEVDKRMSDRRSNLLIGQPLAGLERSRQLHLRHTGETPHLSQLDLDAVIRQSYKRFLLAPQHQPPHRCSCRENSLDANSDQVTGPTGS